MERGTRRRSLGRKIGEGSQGGERENDKGEKKDTKIPCCCLTTEDSTSAPQVLRVGKPDCCM